jgi:hypothetical protein
MNQTVATYISYTSNSYTYMLIKFKQELIKKYFKFVFFFFFRNI